MRTMLAVAYAAILGALAALCVWAGAERGVLVALVDIAGDRWGLTTLVDLYAAFFTVWLWIAWRERSVAARVLWGVLIAGLGSMAIAAYVLGALWRLPPSAGPDALLRRAGEESR